MEPTIVYVHQVPRIIDNALGGEQKKQYLVPFQPLIVITSFQIQYWR